MVLLRHKKSGPLNLIVLVTVLVIVGALIILALSPPQYDSPAEPPRPSATSNDADEPEPIETPSDLDEAETTLEDVRLEELDTSELDALEQELR